jgi:hypothetical protein
MHQCGKTACPLLSREERSVWRLDPKPDDLAFADLKPGRIGAKVGSSQPDLASITAASHASIALTYPRARGLPGCGAARRVSLPHAIWAVPAQMWGARMAGKGGSCAVNHADLGRLYPPCRSECTNSLHSVRIRCSTLSRNRLHDAGSAKSMSYLASHSVRTLRDSSARIPRISTRRLGSPISSLIIHHGDPYVVTTAKRTTL